MHKHSHTHSIQFNTSNGCCLILSRCEEVVEKKVARKESDKVATPSQCKKVSNSVTRNKTQLYANYYVTFCYHDCNKKNKFWNVPNTNIRVSGVQMALICQKRIVCDSSSVLFPSNLSPSSKSSFNVTPLSSLSSAQMTKNYSISHLSTRTKDIRTQHVSTTSTASVDNIRVSVSRDKDDNVDVNSTFAEFIVKNLK